MPYNRTHGRHSAGQQSKVINMDYAADIALFLTVNTGSCLNTWTGKLDAQTQRKLFGRYIGKGSIVINGAHETVCNRVKVCFGLDIDDRNITSWRVLNQG